MYLLKSILVASLLAGISSSLASEQTSDVDLESISELGITTGKPQLSGFVFIEGRYIPPPYTVTRRGSSLFINRIPILQSAAQRSASSIGNVAGGARPIDAEGDFQAVAQPPTQEGSVTPAQGPVPETPATVEAPPVPAIDPPPQAEAVTEARAKVPDVKPAAPATHALDALFEDAPVKPEKGPAVPAATVDKPENAKAASSSEDQKTELKNRLDAQRKNLEQGLVRGDIYFFGQTHSQVNGTYGTARTLLGVLPQVLRYAQSPTDLLARLNQNNIYFLDSALCEALYRNKFTFTLLDERRQQIEEEEALKRPPAARRW